MPTSKLESMFFETTAFIVSWFKKQAEKLGIETILDELLTYETLGEIHPIKPITSATL